MTTSSTVSAARSVPRALLPWLVAIGVQQYHAWKAARRAARADELTWNQALQDARRMAALSRAMAEAARQR